MLSTLRIAATTLALTALLGCPLRANVLVVDASGGGAFTQISAAVSASADGDVILVKSGVYASFSINNKALDVVADVGASASVQGPVAVLNVSATRSVTLTGLTIAGTSAFSALQLSTCTGAVRVQGCTVSGLDQPLCGGVLVGGGEAVRTAYCSDVSFAHCTLAGGDAADYGGSYGENGGSGLDGFASNVALYDCQVSGGAGGSTSAACGGGGGYAGHGAAGAYFASTPVGFVSNSSIVGGRAGLVPPGLGYDGCAGSGLVVSGNASQPSNAIALQSSFVRGPGPMFCIHTIGDVVVLPPNTFTPLTGAARRMTASRVVREQQVARIDFFGQPGDQVRLVFAEAPRFLFSNTWRGVSLVRRPHPSPVQLVGTIGPSGTLSEAWIVPDLGAGVQSRRLFLQAEFVDPTGQKTLGTPATLVLVDAAF